MECLTLLVYFIKSYTLKVPAFYHPWRKKNDLKKKCKTKNNRKYSTNNNPKKPNKPKKPKKPNNPNDPKKPRQRTNRNSELTLTDYQKQAAIGLVLGDVSLEKATPNSNIRLRFDQSLALHALYIFFLYDLFKIFTLSPPKPTNRQPDKRTGKVYNSLIFKTRMLPCFNYLWDLFYLNRVKIVPLNIGELLTVVGLAFWIMDDGGVGSQGTLQLHTDSYTAEEVELLIKVLKSNFNINSRKSLKREGQWIIVIPKSEVPKVAELTISHMHPSMHYKLGR